MILTHGLKFPHQFNSIMKNSSGLNLENAREDEQVSVMRDIIADGVCPFCHDFVDFLEPMYHAKPILHKNSSWIVTENAWPYENTAQHLLFVLRRHITHDSALTQKEIQDLWTLKKRIEKDRTITHGTFLMRSSGAGNTGATVHHLHAQLIVSGDENGVVTKVG